MNKDEYQSQLLENRLLKRYKHLRKWAKRTSVSCYRVYDKDIPEIPLAIDIYEDCENSKIYLHLSLYERPYEKDQSDEEVWLNYMKNACIRVFLVEPSSVFIKTRKKMKGEDQYEKQSDKSFTIIVKEQGQKFLVNLTDYLDTGLFFDHRPLRNMVRSMCQGKKVLNLFCYTGAFSVYAAQGKASKVDSVDLSKTYLTWAQNNMKLNGFLPENNAYSFIQNDTVTFLNSTQNTYDIIILDPPTFSNSKRTSTTLDINRDYPVLINACLSLLSPDGTLFFSTNSKKLFFEPALLNNAGTITDITELTIPEDFRNKKIHRCWKINKK